MLPLEALGESWFSPSQLLVCLAILDIPCAAITVVSASLLQNVLSLCSHHLPLILSHLIRTPVIELGSIPVASSSMTSA